MNLGLFPQHNLSRADQFALPRMSLLLFSSLKTNLRFSDLVEMHFPCKSSRSSSSAPLQYIALSLDFFLSFHYNLSFGPLPYLLCKGRGCFLLSKFPTQALIKQTGP